MGGCLVANECEFTSPLTLVLVGRTGNGKSATGNSILGATNFESKCRSSGVTITSQLNTAILDLDDGRILNVIDTPGLFDSSIDHNYILKEIVRCIDMARDGIHAVLVVFSVRNRFSEEEKAAMSSLLTLFGRKIYDYIIVVFTGGDGLEAEDTTLDDFLCDSSQALKETLSLCGDRYLLFNNKTKDEAKRSFQLHKLLSLVNMVLLENSGKPYSNEMFNEFKKYHGHNQEDILFKRILQMVESRLKEANLKVEQLLTEERAARIEAEKKAEAVQKKSDEEILELKEKIETAEKREKEEQQKRQKEEWEQKQQRKREEQKHCCVIL